MQDNNIQATQSANAAALAANPNIFGGSSASAPTLANGQTAGSSQTGAQAGANAADASGVAPIPNQTPAQQALTAAQNSGAPPQDAATAAKATASITAPPTFYKPTSPVANPAGGNYDPQTVFDAQNKPLDYQSYLKAGGKADFSNVTAGSPPQNSDSSTSTTASTNVPTNVTQTLANDPGYQKLLSDVKDIQSSQANSETLTKTYTDLMNQYNIPGINSELINDQKIINGTVDDIRAEVTAAGGFATESQINGLATARNKTLIQNYNNLLATKTDAMNTINTMVGLAGQDRQFAQTAANNQLNIDTQLADYQQKFLANAKEGYNAVISAVGYAGLYASLQHDPNALSLAEQTLGLPPGTLASIAAIPNPDAQLKAVQLAQAKAGLAQTNQTLALNAAEEPLKVQQLQSQISSSNASAASSAAATAKTNAETDFMNSHNGMTATEYDASIKDQNTQEHTFNTNAANLIGQMASKAITWGTAWNQLHAQYPNLSTQSIDDALNATDNRSKYGG